MTLVILIACSSVATAQEPDVPLWEWRLTRDHLADGVFRPLAGSLPAAAPDRARFDDAAPHALLLAGDAPLVAHAGSLAALDLPREALTVEAWVRIEKRQTWGGFAGLVRDNGDDEKGWILGHDEARFYFGVASEGNGRLTYLRGATDFAPGYWYHVAGTYDGHEQKLFVDGRLDGTSEAQRGPIAYPPEGFLSLGALQDENEANVLAGALASVTVWARALAGGEIAARFRDAKAAFPEVEAYVETGSDWPTHLHDNQRTGISPLRLPLPLELLWTHVAPHPPAPAWPPPARQDFWNDKPRLEPRVTFDRSLPLVAAGDRVWYSSSADDQVRCLDARSGEVLWTYFAEAPVRLAPALAAERLLFGADDGLVRALDAATGALLWRAGPFPPPDVAPWRVPGNGRVISTFAVRSGILVEDDHAFFCAGLFPEQGVTHVALEVASGREIARARLDASVQGYLSRRGGRLYATTGRDRAGAFVGELRRRGKDIPRELRAAQATGDEAFIATADLRLAGGDGTVRAFDVATGELSWEAAIEGRAWILAISSGRLLVSTDRGRIHAFGQRSPHGDAFATRPLTVEAPSPEPLPSTVSDAVRRLLGTCGRARGYALVIIDNDARADIARALATESAMRVVVATRSASHAAEMRALLATVGLSARVAAHVTPDGSLTYAPGIFNLVVDTRTRGAGSVPRDEEEVRRLLVPGGVLGAGDGSVVWLRPEPDGAGRWTHLYADAANTASSGERLLRGPLRVQWFGQPGPERLIDRHHRSVPPLVDAGRLFVPGDERIFGVDAHNGTVLWELELPGTRRVGVLRDSGSMAVDGDRLYVAGQAGCHVIDAAAGRVLATWSPPPDGDITAPAPAEWGYVALAGDLLLGSSVPAGATRRGHSRATIDETYYDQRPLVGSTVVFARARGDGRLIWAHDLEGRLALNPTLAAGPSALYRVETAPLDDAARRAGRVQLAAALGDGARVVACDRATGEPLWSVPAAIRAEHNLYLVATGESVILVGSRNSGADPKRDRVLFEIVVLDALSGATLWTRTQTQPANVGGSHGEQDFHPAVIGTTLFCEPFAYDLPSGEPLADFGWRRESRRGCGTVSASASALFFRDGSARRFDLETNEYRAVTAATRPGCWINMIPAAGLLLVPEASSGCSCDYAVQTSLAFAPAE